MFLSAIQIASRKPALALTRLILKDSETDEIVYKLCGITEKKKIIKNF